MPDDTASPITAAMSLGDQDIAQLDPACDIPRISVCSSMEVIKRFLYSEWLSVDTRMGVRTMVTRSSLILNVVSSYDIVPFKDAQPPS